MFNEQGHSSFFLTRTLLFKPLSTVRAQQIQLLKLHIDTVDALTQYFESNAHANEDDITTLNNLRHRVNVITQGQAARNKS